MRFMEITTTSAVYQQSKFGLTIRSLNLMQDEDGESLQDDEDLDDEGKYEEGDEDEQEFEDGDEEEGEEEPYDEEGEDDGAEVSSKSGTSGLT